MRNSKVAITTWFHYENYGTALQVVALYNVVSSLGYRVDVVNYLPHGTRYTNNSHTFFSPGERVNDERRSEKYSQFVGENLSFTKQCIKDEDFFRLNKEYDAFIAGSDQVWSPVVFDPRFYLDYVSDNRKKISYAASFGVPEVKVKMIRERMKCLISQFAHLSAREKSGAKLIKDLTSLQAKIVLDPTLLLDYNEWRKIIKKPSSKTTGQYILCYFLANNENQWKHAEKVSKQTGLPIKIVPIFAEDARRGEFVYGTGPAEFFNLIDDAQLVLTDSYHGAILSIICQTPFYVFERFRRDDPVSQNSRVYSLLEMTGLNDRLIRYEEPVKQKYTTKIKYESVMNALEKIRMKSIEYLATSLKIGTPLVSVIMPVHNVEKYLRKCLDSILVQTYKNLEIIIVNDGSRDRSGVIADEYAQRDKRIKVIHKENGGVSSARNTGLDMATGEYVMFVDSDDVVAPNFVEYMLGLIENRKSNIATLLNFHNEYSEDQNITPLNDYIEMYESEKAIEGIYSWFFPLSVDIKIYRRSFIENNNLRFLPELIFAEGMTFNIMALQNSGPVAVGKRQLYHQTFNPDYVTHTTNIKGWETCFKAYEYQKKHSKIWNDRIDRAHAFHAWLCNSSIARQIYRNGEEKKYRRFLWKYIWRMRLNLRPVLRANLSPEQKKAYIRMAFRTKKELERINEEEKIRIKKMAASGVSILPWERPPKPPAPIVVEPEPTEADYLRSEIERLHKELESFLSVKRSARLFAGNIKRAILRRIIK